MTFFIDYKVFAAKFGVFVSIVDNKMMTTVENATNGAEVIYMDYNATCPVAREVKESITYALEHFWGNPSSNNAFGMNT